MALKRESLDKPLYEILEAFIPRGNKEAPDASDMRYRVPGHQRHFVWPAAMQESLIDSVFKGYPIPSILLLRKRDETGADFYNIEDGQQRVTTLHAFRNNHFSVDIGGTPKCYKDLAKAEERVFDNYLLHCDIYNGIDVEESVIATIFMRINQHKPLSDNEKYYSRMSSSPMLKFVQDVCETKGIETYMGKIAHGKTRSGLSDMVGAVLSIALNRRNLLTTAYNINGIELDATPTKQQMSRVVTFFNAFLGLLDETVGEVTKRPKKHYGKLSSFLGLACCSYIEEEGEIHEAIGWYIGKMFRNKDYVPRTFSALRKGDLRNCQGDSILNRYNAIKEQYEKEEEDSGGSVEISESEEEDE